MANVLKILKNKEKQILTSDITLVKNVNIVKNILQYLKKHIINSKRDAEILASGEFLKNSGMLKNELVELILKTVKDKAIKENKKTSKFNTDFEDLKKRLAFLENENTNFKKAKKLTVEQQVNKMEKIQVFSENLRNHKKLLETISTIKLDSLEDLSVEQGSNYAVSLKDSQGRVLLQTQNLLVLDVFIPTVIKKITSNIKQLEKNILNA